MNTQPVIMWPIIRRCPSRWHKPEGEVLGEVLGEVFEQHLPFGFPLFIGFPDKKGRWGGVFAKPILLVGKRCPFDE